MQNIKNLLIFCVFCVLVNSSIGRQSRIINGQQSPSMPHHAFIEYLYANGTGLIGGGSLISNMHILTAAQVVSGFYIWNVGLGSTLFFQLRRFSTTNAITHPDYEPVSRANDIGVIILNSPITISATIAPIALPALNTIYPYENEEGIIVGFGYTSDPGSRAEILMRTFQRVISNDQCLQFYNTVSVPNHFCVHDYFFASNICYGDIGGGFIVSIRGEDVLVGISSLITRHCDNQEPSALLRVASYRQWIQTVSGV